MPPGTLAIPTVFAGHSPQAVSTLDTDLATIASYINNREVTLGALSARPAAGNAGAWYVATDTSGGTLYVDNGSTWVQVATGVTATRAGSYEVRGLFGNPNAGTPNTQYDLTSADLVQLRNPTDGTILVKTAVGLFTCDLTVAQAVNGRDTAGALGTSAFVHLYYITKADGTGTGSLASATAPPTGPALPAGYTHWAYAGAVWNAAGPALRKTLFRGAMARMVGTAVFRALAAGVAQVETAISLATFIPANASRVMINLAHQNTVTAGASTAIYERTGESATAFTLLAPVTSVLAVADVVLANVSQQIFYINAQANGQTTVDILGYYMPNGDS